MGNLGITNTLTKADRTEWLAKARAARATRVPADVKDDFLDMGYWEQLASDFGIRLPIAGQIATRAKITKFLKRIGVTPKAYCIWTGSKTFKEAVALTKGVGLRSIAGMALESRDKMLRYMDESAENARGRE